MPAFSSRPARLPSEHPFDSGRVRVLDFPAFPPRHFPLPRLTLPEPKVSFVFWTGCSAALDDGSVSDAAIRARGHEREPAVLTDEPQKKESNSEIWGEWGVAYGGKWVYIRDLVRSVRMRHLLAAVVTSLAPVAPKGCPMEREPPCLLTISMGIAPTY